MENSFVYRLTGGTVAKCPLATWAMPAACVGRVEVRPGEVDHHTLAALPAAAAIIHRICPWARSYGVPRLSAVCYDGPDLLPSRGYHQWESDDSYIFLDMWGIEDELLSTAYHEAFHGVQRFMAPHCLEILTEIASRGHRYSDPYMRHPMERLARGFASWAMARLECPPEPGWRPTTSRDLMFSQIESGEMAALVMGIRRAA